MVNRHLGCIWELGHLSFTSSQQSQLDLAELVCWRRGGKEHQSVHGSLRVEVRKQLGAQPCGKEADCIEADSPGPASRSGILRGSRAGIKRHVSRK